MLARLYESSYEVRADAMINELGVLHEELLRIIDPLKFHLPCDKFQHTFNDASITEHYMNLQELQLDLFALRHSLIEQCLAYDAEYGDEDEDEAV